jgi:LacI family transcriptional regulator
LFGHQPTSFFQDPFHAALLGGIEKKLRELRYYLMVRTVANESELYSLLNNWTLDGLILTGLFNDSFFARLLEANKPIVLLDSYIKDSRIFNIGLDDYKGGFMATHYLIDKGHRDIVFASPSIKKNGVIEERFKGYKAALKKNGIPFSSRNVYQQDTSLNEGIALGHALAGRKEITAVFATADILAAGIISGLNHAGLCVPADISIIGFDDTFYSRIISPPLTTIHQDMEEKGAVAARLMADYLEGKEKSPRSIIMPLSLVERESVKTLQ